MDSIKPMPGEVKDTAIISLGERRIPSPFHQANTTFVEDNSRIAVYSRWEELEQYFSRQESPPLFELAGSRKRIFFDPSRVTCGIVTCGGLCPGLNDVIRTITLTLLWQYGVNKVLGFRYGYQGLSLNPHANPLELTPDVVEDIQHEGGTLLGTSRGPQDVREMVEVLLKYEIGILFVIGGDGTFSGAMDICSEIERQNLSMSVIGVPKTIDNDIYCSELTFGFNSAVEAARKSIYSAHEEAKAVWNGVGLVKLMGRDAGFIATYASLANSDANFCFIPEVSFGLHGEGGLLPVLERRLEKKHHAVIVVAEGAGQDLIGGSGSVEKDASGNIRQKDIGLFLKQHINEHFKRKISFFNLKIYRSRLYNSQLSG